MSGIIDTVGQRSGIVGSDVYPAGHVIQVVKEYSDSYVQSDGTGGSASNVWGNTTGIPSLVITPKYSNSRIILFLTINVHSAAHAMYVDFGRAIAGGASTSNLTGETDGLATSGMDFTQQVGITYVDSPSTTSAITYRGSFRSSGTGQVVYFGNGSGRSTITAMEVKV